MDEYININKIAKIKGLKSTRSIRIAIQNGKYIARKVPVQGGTTYEILYSSLELEIQEKLEDENIKSTAIIPYENKKTTFICESAKLTALARVDIVEALLNVRRRYKTQKEADEMSLDERTEFINDNMETLTEVANEQAEEILKKKC